MVLGFDLAVKKLFFLSSYPINCSKFVQNFLNWLMIKQTTLNAIVEKN